VLQLSNTTPFDATFVVLPDVDGVTSIFTMVKGTFTVDSALRVADEQVPISMADVHYDDPGKTSVRQPSDVCLGKSSTDVLLVGSAWAPGGQPAWQSDVSLGVNGVTKSARVFGDRVWDGRSGVASAAWIAPFTRMPLTWERAFGGTVGTDKGPRAELRNPVGVGFTVSGASDEIVGRPLPNVEDPTVPLSSPRQSVTPSGFAPIPAHWEPRRSYAGTYDDAWQRSRAPYLPSDFDRRFFQQAPQGLVMPGFLQGGELVELRGLTPSGFLRFALPMCRVSVTHRLDSAKHTLPARLETVLLEPDQTRVVMLWRSSFRCDKKALRVREVEAVLITTDARQ
jgi:hypothetical protein